MTAFAESSCRRSPHADCRTKLREDVRYACLAMLRRFHGTVADVSRTSTGSRCRVAAVTDVCGFVNYWTRFTQLSGGLGAAHPQIECRRSRYRRQLSQTVQTLPA